MKKTKQTSTKLLVIAITAAAILAAATSITGAKPAFANINCDVADTTTVCSGGSSFQNEGNDIPGGRGLHVTISPDGQTYSDGYGGNDGTSAGGAGEHATCDASGINCERVGGGGGTTLPSN
jgi:hypothetical protein